MVEDAVSIRGLSTRVPQQEPEENLEALIRPKGSSLDLEQQET